MNRWWLLALLLLCQPPQPAQAGQGDDPQGDAPHADAPAMLSRGINITGWFRFPASRQPGVLAGYMGDQALADLRTAGFDFVRLAVDPAVVAAPTDRAMLIDAIRHIQRHGLSVVISPHPQDWHLETEPADQARLGDFWHALAPALQPLDPARTVPEVLNEPVFPGDPAGWGVLQHRLLSDLRRTLPHRTIVLTGQDWGSIKGLLAVQPEDDPAVLYSFHLYDPAELTSLAAYRPDLDRASLARLPFPVADAATCNATAQASPHPATRDLMRYYCALDWNQARITATIDQAADWARLHHVHLLAGEFGATAQLNAPARQAWLRIVRQTLEARGIGWALWGYDDMMGLAVPRPPGWRPVLDRDVLTALGLSTRM